MHLKQAGKCTLQRRQTRMTQKLNEMEKSYKMLLAYGKKDENGTVARSEEGQAINDSNGLYVVRDGITLTTDEMDEPLMWVCPAALRSALFQDLRRCLKLAS